MTKELIKVAVSGARGRMGREVLKMVLNTEQFQLVAAIDAQAGGDAGSLIGHEPCGVEISNNLASALAESGAEVMVDFTTPHVVMDNTKTAIRNQVRPVIGTTGLSMEQIEELDELCQEQGIGGIIAPNFSIGAILMMKFAAQAAKHMPDVEIIEFHGDQKYDAPSGTAVQTAQFISEVREEFKQGNPQEEEVIEGARGGYYDGFRIHSVRLPGVFAQQEVIFGGDGQTLKIRHDSYERSGYMPGVKLAIQKAIDLTNIVYGFEHFID